MEQQSIMELKDCVELILAINFAWNGNKLSAADKIIEHSRDANTHHQFIESELQIDQDMELAAQYSYA